MVVEYRIPLSEHPTHPYEALQAGTHECQFHGYIKDFNELTNCYVVTVSQQFFLHPAYDPCSFPLSPRSIALMLFPLTQNHVFHLIQPLGTTLLLSNPVFIYPGMSIAIYVYNAWLLTPYALCNQCHPTPPKLRRCVCGRLGETTFWSRI